MKLRLAALCLLSLLSLPARAAPDAVVSGLELPAWVEREGARLPLAPGALLKAGDRVSTGGGGRLLVRTGDGSLVKLGENGSLGVDRIGPAAGDRALFTAALDVLKGAFRFTTQAAGKMQKRQVDVRIATLTAGIRGTDLWGKADADRDIVCLIEGRIGVQRGGDPEFTMDQPLSFYIAPKDAPALPVAPVSPEQLKIWAAETETAPGRGVLKEKGPWKVNLASLDDQGATLALYDRLRHEGYPADIQPVKVDGKQYYRVRITDLAGEADARALAARMKGQFGISEPWVSKQ